MQVWHVYVAALLLVGIPAAGAQEATSTPDPAPGAVSEDAPGLAPVRDLIGKAEASLAALEDLIVQQDAHLDDLYSRRDASAATGQGDRAAQFDNVINRMTVTLDDLEAERDAITSLIATLEAQLAILAPVPAPSTTGNEH